MEMSAFDENADAAPVRAWLAVPMQPADRAAIERVRRAADVMHVAVMPDVHLASDVCVGTATTTRHLVYPGAVGGDIGCGMLALAFDASADALSDPAIAGRLLRLLGERIPANRHNRARATQLVSELDSAGLSHPSLSAAAVDNGALQLGTLGGGNHFVELQADEDGRLWAMIHSGSRGMGQLIRGHHLARATIRSGPLLALDTETDVGQAYLRDQEWARRYAAANRTAMGRAVATVVSEVIGAKLIEPMTIACDHNDVRFEEHSGQSLLVHRKGAVPADAGLAGVVPGSMGTLSYHVEGRGCAGALRSSAHGAGCSRGTRRASASAGTTCADRWTACGTTRGWPTRCARSRPSHTRTCAPCCGHRRT
jgi:tRNA-splicing ligase RtcB